MKTLCAAVLAFEAIVVLLAIPVAIVVQEVPREIGLSVGLALVALCVYLCAIQRKKSWGVAGGWVMQVLVVLTGFVVPMMFFLGVMFGLLWFYAIRLGKRGDEIKVERDAAVAAREAAEAGA